MSNSKNQKNITCKDDLWLAAQAKTAFSMSKLVRILLKAFVDGDITIGIDGRVTRDK